MWVLIFFLITLPLWWMLTLKIYSFVKEYWLEIVIFIGKTFWFLLKVGLVCLIIGAITLLIIKLTENKKDNYYQSNYEYVVKPLPPPPPNNNTSPYATGLGLNYDQLQEVIKVMCKEAKTFQEKKELGCK